MPIEGHAMNTFCEMAFSSFELASATMNWQFATSSSKWQSLVQSGSSQFRVAIASSNWQYPVRRGSHQFNVAIVSVKWWSPVHSSKSSANEKIVDSMVLNSVCTQEIRSKFSIRIVVLVNNITTYGFAVISNPAVCNICIETNEVWRNGITYGFHSRM